MRAPQKRFKVGDLIYTEWEGGNQVYTSLEGQLEFPAFRFEHSDIGLVLQIKEMNKTDIKIAVGNKVGWTNSNFYTKIKLHSRITPWKIVQRRSS